MSIFKKQRIDYAVTGVTAYSLRKYCKSLLKPVKEEIFAEPPTGYVAKLLKAVPTGRHANQVVGDSGVSTATGSGDEPDRFSSGIRGKIYERW